MSQARRERPLPRTGGMTYSYVCVYAAREPSRRAGPRVRHLVEREHGAGQMWVAVRTLCDVQAGQACPSGSPDFRDPATANCTACKRIYKLIMAVTDQDCPGSGRPWVSGDARPICKACRRRAPAIGARVPRGRTYPHSGWRGRVPAHPPRTFDRKES